MRYKQPGSGFESDSYLYFRGVSLLIWSLVIYLLCDQHPGKTNFSLSLSLSVCVCVCDMALIHHSRSKCIANKLRFSVKVYVRQIIILPQNIFTCFCHGTSLCHESSWYYRLSHRVGDHVGTTDHDHDVTNHFSVIEQLELIFCFHVTHNHDIRDHPDDTCHHI